MNEDVFVDEELLEQQYTADALGMIDYKHFLEFKENVVKGLMLFGNKFQEGLGMTLGEAEDKDAVKIIHTWKNECSVHEMLYRMHEAKQIAKENELNTHQCL
jgi:hypothetical protein